MPSKDFICDDCGTRYRSISAGGQIDLRITSTKTTKFTYNPSMSQNSLESELCRTIAPSLNPANPHWVDVPLGNDLTYGNRLTRTLLSYFPRSRKDEWMLDLGCGDRRFEPLCRSLTGFNYLGIDYDGASPDVLADAHALPFQDKCFGFVLSVAVLEHLAAPAMAMSEVMRVLKPGGIFIGTVAFLEPFHMDSHFHMSHMGLARVLIDAGLEVIAIEPNRKWSGLRAQSEMALFRGRACWFQRAMVAVPHFASRATDLLKAGRRSKAARLSDPAVATTGGFRFIARRPVTSIRDEACVERMHLAVANDTIVE